MNIAVPAPGRHVEVIRRRRGCGDRRVVVIRRRKGVFHLHPLG